MTLDVDVLTIFPHMFPGPLADSIFEPAMQPGSSLSAVLGGLVGTGPGAGMAVMFLGTALLGTMMSLSGYLIRAVRCVEDEASESSMRGKSREESPATTPVMGLDSPLEV